MINACFHAAIKAPLQLISDSIQQSSLFCLKMLNYAVRNGSPCKSFFNEMRNSKFIQWICEWQEAFSIKHTHLPLNDQPWFIDYLIRGMSKEKRSLISISVWRERESFVTVHFYLTEYSNDTSYLSTTTKYNIKQHNKQKRSARGRSPLD